MSPHTVTTFRYDASSDGFVKKSTQRELGLHEVKIKLTHAGLCYTDVHAKRSGCGLGHEGAGIVTDVGGAVTSMKTGDRVGWGWLRTSCGNCPSCIDGYRQYCAQARGFGFCDQEQGAFADYHIIDASFAYYIPDCIPSPHAAVFMCAGASTYEALQAASVKPHHRIGIVGLGGLGHMAILFAKAMGCGITVFTRPSQHTTSKADDAFNLGADEICFLDNLDTAWVLAPGSSVTEAKVAAPVDILLICANETPDLEKMLPSLARRATIVLMSIQQQPLVIPYMSFILPGHKLIASTEASRQNHIAMMEFVARHQIKPWLDMFPMTEVGLKEAFGRLERGEVRFRAVLEVPN